jgi:ribonuclease HI
VDKKCALLLISMSMTQQARVAKWEPPTDGFYKINVDATFIDATSKGGWSFVARDKEVEYMEGGCGNLPRVACPLQVEAMAPLFSLERAAYVGMSKTILKTDATELEKGITTKELNRSVDESLFGQIRGYMTSSFDVCRVRHCPRSYNKVADCLTKYGASIVSSGSVMFLRQVPAFIENLLSDDLPGDGV